MSFIRKQSDYKKNTKYRENKKSFCYLEINIEKTNPINNTKNLSVYCLRSYFNHLLITALLIPLYRTFSQNWDKLIPPP